MGRRILAILAGFILAIVVIFAVEYCSHLVYPLPPGVDPTNAEALRSVMSRMPTGAFVFLLAGWLLGTATGAATAQRINRAPTLVPGLVVGAMIFAASVFNFKAIPHPVWVVAVALVGIPAVAYLATRAATAPSTATAAVSS